MPTETPLEPRDSAVLPDHLLEELERVLLLLRDGIHDSGQVGELALIRVVSGISLEDWKRVASQFPAEGWFALPLDRPVGTAVQTVRETLEKLLYQRDHDVLTGLANRRFFDRALGSEVERGERTHTELSLVMFDIDNFKAVNDLHGHACGDEVLARLGALLKSSMRHYDMAARIGGEEFCLILPGASSWKAVALARRVLELFRLEEFEAPNGTRFHVSFSAGVSTSIGQEGGISGQALLSMADAALYRAKREGKNRVVVAGPSANVSDNAALVRAAEKKFLFSGDDG